MRKYEENTGITLIALVITIIVLLILAGVSISMLTGQNGILNRAAEAKEKTDQAQKEEQNTMLSYEDEMSNYLGVDWESAKANAKAPDEQKEERNNGVIGIGTNGKAVNMDLWEYTKLDDGTYSLNTETNLNTEASAGVTSGYKGDFSEEGKISGTIPQYISSDNGSTFQAVTDLKWLFYNCADLKVMPKLPETAKSMRFTFRDCTNLSVVSDIPDGVTDISRCFLNCSSIVNAPNLPDTIIDMSVAFTGCSNLKYCYKLPRNVQDLTNTFSNCSNLISVTEIPESVISMHSTFSLCVNLKSVGKKIPANVKDMYKTFQRCTNLTGTLEIDANLTGATIDNRLDYEYCFVDAVTSDGAALKLTGNETSVKNLLTTKSENSNIS